MSVQAYILVQTEVGKSDEVAQAINAIDGVMNSEHVTGPYDVIVRAEAKSIDDLAKVIFQDYVGLVIYPNGPNQTIQRTVLW